MNIETEIRNDWLSEFQNLKGLSKTRIGWIVGPTLVTIELIKAFGGECYRPHLVIYPLWGPSAKDCLDTPILMFEFYDKRDLQFSIRYSQHKQFFNEMVQSITEKCGSIFLKDANIADLNDIIDDYSKTSILRFAPYSFLNAVLLKNKILLNLCSGNKDEVYQTLERIDTTLWNIENFTAFGVDYKKWYNEILSAIENPSDLVQMVEMNKKDKKFVSLNHSKL